MTSSSPRRNDAINLIHTDFAAGVALARQVANPWARAQALAWAGHKAPLGEAPDLILEAAAAAALGADDFQRMAVLAWPLFAALARDLGDVAESIQATALAGLPDVTPAPSRAMAIKLLFQGTLAARRPRRFSEPLLDVLRATCPPDERWQSALTYRCIADIIAERDGGSARKFCLSMPEGKARALCLRDRERHRRRRSRRLIW